MAFFAILSHLASAMKESALGLEHRVEQANNPGPSQDPAATAIPPPTRFWRRLARRVRSCLEIPYGYEDESGFHLGEEPVPPDIAAKLADSRRLLTDRACDAMPSPSPVSDPSFETPAKERGRTV